MTDLEQYEKDVKSAWKKLNESPTDANRWEYIRVLDIWLAARNLANG